MSDAHLMPDEAPVAELAKWIALLERDLSYLNERAEAEAAMWRKAIRDKRARLAQVRAVYDIRRRGEAPTIEKEQITKGG